IVENVSCWLAMQDMVWVYGAVGSWEIYAVLDDSEIFGQ
ncbi:MAG: hypothetical protein QOG30_3644, partial [Acidimicrobiaceae bacterium]